MSNAVFLPLLILCSLLPTWLITWSNMESLFVSLTTSLDLWLLGRKNLAYRYPN